MSFLFESNLEAKAVFTFGRMNPPTAGHEHLVSTLVALAKQSQAKPFIFLSSTTDADKNPLSPDAKSFYARTAFPGVPVEVVKMVGEAVDWLAEQGFKKITMVVGDDRVSAFQRSLPNYAMKQHSMEMTVVSAGERDPDADDITGVSASKMRQAVRNGDYTAYLSMVPSKFTDANSKAMYNSLKAAMTEQ